MVKWPWVSRALYEALDRHFDIVRGEATDLGRSRNDWMTKALESERRVLACERGEEILRRLYDAQIADLRAQVAAKDAAILAMKREGFDPPDPRPPTVHEIRAKLPAIVLHRIEQIAQPGTKEHFEMLAEAEALVGAYPDRPAEQIADEVAAGSPINPYRL